MQTRKTYKLDENIYYSQGPVALKDGFIAFIAHKNVTSGQIYIYHADKISILEHHHVNKIIALSPQKFASISNDSVKIWDMDNFSYKEIPFPAALQAYFINAVATKDGKYLIGLYQPLGNAKEEVVWIIDTDKLTTQISQVKYPKDNWLNGRKANLTLLPNNQLALYGANRRGVLLFDLDFTKENWCTFKDKILLKREICHLICWPNEKYWGIFENNIPELPDGSTPFNPILSIWTMNGIELSEKIYEYEAYVHPDHPEASTVVLADGTLVFSAGHPIHQRISLYNPDYDSLFHIDKDTLDSKIALTHDQHLILISKTANTFSLMKTKLIEEMILKDKKEYTSLLQNTFSFFSPATISTISDYIIHPRKPADKKEPEKVYSYSDAFQTLYANSKYYLSLFADSSVATGKKAATTITGMLYKR